MAFRIFLRHTSKVSNVAQQNVLHHTVLTKEHQTCERCLQSITFHFDVESDFLVLQSFIHQIVYIAVNVDTNNKPTI